MTFPEYDLVITRYINQISRELLPVWSHIPTFDLSHHSRHSIRTGNSPTKELDLYTKPSLTSNASDIGMHESHLHSTETKTWARRLTSLDGLCFKAMIVWAIIIWQVFGSQYYIYLLWNRTRSTNKQPKKKTQNLSSSQSLTLRLLLTEQIHMYMHNWMALCFPAAK